MRKMLLSLSTGYMGSNSKQAWLVPESITEEELDEAAYDYALENAARYGIYPYPEDEEHSEEGSYSSSISGCFREFKESDRSKVIYGAQGDVYWNTW